jgi:hypothetical protein
MSIEIPEFSIEEWVNELKPYQRNSINQLLKSNQPTDAAKIWLTSHGAMTTIPFGGIKDASPFWNNFFDEFNKFICDDNSYKDEKRDFGKEVLRSKTLIISAISAAIGAKLGYSATFLAPSVVLLLFTVGKMTRNAYCATYYDSKKTS